VKLGHSGKDKYMDNNGIPLSMLKMEMTNNECGD
jgi:hypothetical protein